MIQLLLNLLKSQANVGGMTHLSPHYMFGAPADLSPSDAMRWVARDVFNEAQRPMPTPELFNNPAKAIRDSITGTMTAPFSAVGAAFAQRQADQERRLRSAGSPYGAPVPPVYPTPQPLVYPTPRPFGNTNGGMYYPPGYR